MAQRFASYSHDENDKKAHLICKILKSEIKGDWYDVKCEVTKDNVLVITAHNNNQKYVGRLDGIDVANDAVKAKQSDGNIIVTITKPKDREYSLADRMPNVR